MSCSSRPATPPPSGSRVPPSPAPCGGCSSTARGRPGGGVAKEAEDLWPRRGRGGEKVERRIAELKLVTPHYQHVDGTSFAAPIVSSVLACMLEANPKLSALRLRELALAATLTVPGAEHERQGGGVIVADWAVKLALADRDPDGRPLVRSPLVTTDAVLFRLLEPSAA